MKISKKNNKPIIEITRWNVLSIFGWVNVVLGIIALLPAVLGDTSYWFYGGISGLVVGGILVSLSGPLKTIEKEHWIKII